MNILPVSFSSCMAFVKFTLNFLSLHSFPLYCQEIYILTVPSSSSSSSSSTYIYKAPFCPHFPPLQIFIYSRIFHDFLHLNSTYWRWEKKLWAFNPCFSFFSSCFLLVFSSFYSFSLFFSFFSTYLREGEIQFDLSFSLNFSSLLSFFLPFSSYLWKICFFALSLLFLFSFFSSLTRGNCIFNPSLFFLLLLFSFLSSFLLISEG